METETQQMETETEQTGAPEAADDRMHTSDLLDQTSEPAEAAGPSTTPDSGEARMPLLDDAPRLTGTWQEIQARFVDAPRTAVEDADALVAEIMRRLAETFAEERERLERDWHAGDEVSTEDLRVALQRYRSFFERLLAA
jgi:hypothetical protein